MAITTSTEYEYSKEEFVDFVLKENPWLKAHGATASMIYNFGKDKYKVDSPKNKGRIEPWEIKEAAPKPDTSPGWFKYLASYAVDDESYNWRKASLANSMTGAVMQMSEEGLPFEVTPEIENLAWYEEALAGAMSMIYPLDVFTLGLGGVAAVPIKAVAKKGLVTAGMSSFAKNNIKKGLVKETAKKYGVTETAASAILDKTIGTSATLATFEGAKGGLTAKANGASDEEILNETMHGIVHGGVIGAVLGGTGGWLARSNSELALVHALKRKGGISGIGKGKAPELKKLANWDKYGNMSLKQIENKLAYTGKFPQFMSEMSVFTGATQVDRALQGEELTWKTLARDIGVNAGFLGVMKGGAKILSKGAEGAGEVVREYKTYHEIEKIKALEELDVLNKLKDDADSKVENARTPTERAAAVETSKTIAEEIAATTEKALEKLKEESLEIENIENTIDGLSKINFEELTLLELKDRIEIVKDNHNVLNSAVDMINKMEAKEKDSGGSLPVKLAEIRTKIETQLKRLNKEFGKREKVSTERELGLKKFLVDEEFKRLEKLKEKPSKKELEELEAKYEEMTLEELEAEYKAKKFASEEIGAIERAPFEEALEGAGLMVDVAKQKPIKEGVAKLKEGKGDKLEVDNARTVQGKSPRIKKAFEKLDEDTQTHLIDYGSKSETNLKHSEGARDFFTWLKEKKKLGIKDINGELVKEYFKFKEENPKSLAKILGRNVAINKKTGKGNVYQVEKTGLKAVLEAGKDVWYLGKNMPLESAYKVVKTARGGKKPILGTVQDITMAGKLKASIGEVITKFKTYTKDVKDRAKLLTELIGYGLRRKEINKFTKKNILAPGEGANKTKDYVFLMDASVAKPGSWLAESEYSILIPLSPSLGKKIYSHASKFKAGELIFGARNKKGKPSSFEVDGKSLMSQIAKIVFPKGGEKVTWRDSRTILRTKAALDPKMKEALGAGHMDVYLRHIASADVESIYTVLGMGMENQAKISKIVQQQLGIHNWGIDLSKIDYSNLEKSFEAAFKPKKKVKTKKPKSPQPPQTKREALIERMEEARSIHKESAKDRILSKLYRGGKKAQMAYADAKEVVIAALSGKQGWLNKKALKLVDDMIISHKETIEYLKTDKGKLWASKHAEIGSIKHHERWINTYEQVKQQISSGKSETFDGIKPDGKNYTTRELQKVGFSAQDGAGVSKKILGNEAYRKKMRQDTKELFGEESSSISELSKNRDKMIEYINMLENPQNYTSIKRGLGAKRRNLERILDQTQEIGMNDVMGILKALGVKDGKLETLEAMDLNLAKQTYDKLISYVSSMKGKKFEIETQTDVIFGLENETISTNLSWNKKTWHSLIDLLGSTKSKVLHKIAQTFVAFDVLNAYNKKRTTETVKFLKAELKKAGFKKADDMDMWRLFDKELREDLTPDEARFVKLLDKKGSILNKAVERIVSADPEVGLLSHYWHRIFEEVSKFAPKFKIEQLEDMMSKKFVKNYYTRTISVELRKAFQNLDNQEWYNKLVKDNVNDYARREGIKAGNKLKKGKGESEIDFKSRKKQKVKEVTDLEKNDLKIHEKVKDDIYNYFFQSGTKLKSDFLYARKMKLPRKVIVNLGEGKFKTIKAYDETFSGTIEHYGVGMSKYLAALRYFPEFTDLGSKFGQGKMKKNVLDILQEGKGGMQNREWVDYIALGIEDTLGLNSGLRNRVNRDAHRGLGIIASTSAALGLSSPTSGLKNLAIGIPRAMATFGVLNTTVALGRFMANDADLAKRDLGWVKEYGSKKLLLETQEAAFEKIPFVGKHLTMDKIFKYNFMTTSEGINRVASAYAGGMYFENLLGAYHNQASSEWWRKTFASEKEILRAFKSIWRLSKDEVDFLTKNKGEKGWKDINSAKNKEMRDWIQNKVYHYSHASSQGSTSSTLLPQWMSSPVMKPFTLFHRMAWSTTADIGRNFIKPIKETGNIAPLVRATFAHGLSGMALYKLYEHAFGYDVPWEESESMINKILPYLWRSEFFGMFGEFVNPHSSPIYPWLAGGRADFNKFISPGDANLAAGMAEPVIWRNAHALLEATGSLPLFGGSKTYSQVATDLAKNTTPILSQVIRMAKKYENPEDFITHKNLRTDAREFKLANNYTVPSAILGQRINPYYRDIKEAFWGANEEQWAKRFWQAMNYIDDDLASQKVRDPRVRRKKAITRIKSSLKSFEPINFTVEINGRLYSKRKEFLEYLTPAKRKEALRLEKEYYYLYRKFWRAVMKDKYRKKYSNDVVTR